MRSAFSLNKTVGGFGECCFHLTAGACWCWAHAFLVDEQQCVVEVVRQGIVYPNNIDTRYEVCIPPHLNPF